MGITWNEAVDQDAKKAADLPLTRGECAAGLVPAATGHTYFWDARDIVDGGDAEASLISYNG